MLMRLAGKFKQIKPAIKFSASEEILDIHFGIASEAAASG